LIWPTSPAPLSPRSAPNPSLTRAQPNPPAEFVSCCDARRHAGRSPGQVPG
jgi:hypothetical protein